MLNNKKIRVLVVDDSLTKRDILSNMINSAEDMEVVGIASDGKEACRMCEVLRPDVITMDIKMPEMDGIEATKRIMKNTPTPILIVSATDQIQVRFTMEALSYGAVDFLPISNDLDKMKEELLKKIRIASRIKVVRYIGIPEKEKFVKEKFVFRKTSSKKVVAIGVSTGGPMALLTILSQFPENISAGIIIVQHMVEGFTKGLADWLDSQCKIKVKEAKDRDFIQEGVALICPGNSNLTVTATESVRLIPIPAEAVYKPSIDEMMCSAAKVYGENLIGVILTGMGRDGVEGMKAIKKAGGITIAQDESSCVVFGMPKVAIEEGCIDKILHIKNIAREIMNLI